jgi:hypothetical protein
MRKQYKNVSLEQPSKKVWRDSSGSGIEMSLVMPCWMQIKNSEKKIMKCKIYSRNI